MHSLTQFTALGLATGGLYALLSLGLIVVFRSSGVVNFSHAGIALVSAYIYYDLRSLGHGAVYSVVAGIVAGAVLGFLIYVLVIRMLRRASALTKGVATLAVLVVLQSAITLKFGASPLLSPNFLTAKNVHLLGSAVPVGDVAIFCICGAFVAILSLIYRRTRFGMATSAVAENEFAFSTLGGSSTRVAVLNWTVGGALAAVAGVAVAPLIAISPDQATTLLIPALAAALCGGFRSFAISFVGAVTIGLGQSYLTWYMSLGGPASNVPGLPDALPFVLIIAVLMIRGRNMPSRDFVAAALPRLGSARLTLGWSIFWSLLAVAVLVGASDDWVIGMTTGVTAGMMLLSLVVVAGYAGQLSLAQVSIAGVGVLVASWLVADHSWPMPLAAIVGVLCTVPVALLIGLPALKTRGITLAVVTLGLAQCLNSLLFTRDDVNAHGTGMTIGTANFFGITLDELFQPRRYAVFVLLVLLVVLVAISNLRRSRIGGRLVAVRLNERAAASVGINVTGSKLYAFTLAGAIAGVAGLLQAWRVPNVIFSSAYDAFQSVNTAVATTLGGIGYLSGGLVGGLGTAQGGPGAMVVSLIGLGEWLSLVTGGLLLVTVVFNPDGVVPNTMSVLWPAAARVSERLSKFAPARSMARRSLLRLPRSWPSMSMADSHDTVANGLKPQRDVLLELRDLRVSFGGVKALCGVDAQLRGGEVLGVIGPNGSGKTTLIDAVTGYVQASGTVRLNGRRVDRLPTFRRSRAGICRSFQSLELFGELSVADQLLVASGNTSWSDWLMCFVWPRRIEPNAAVRAAVSNFALNADYNRLPGELPYGKRRLLAISRALATSPSVLLLDEPAAGLGDEDRAELGTMIRRLADDWGMAILLIEHDVDLVMDVSDRVMALEFGNKIAEGTPNDVRRHPEVLRSYLGEPDEPGEDQQVDRAGANT